MMVLLPTLLSLLSLVQRVKRLLDSEGHNSTRVGSERSLMKVVIGGESSRFDVLSTLTI